MKATSNIQHSTSNVQVPLTETQHLLLCLAEECAEVAQRVSKALRFGLYEVQEGHTLTNAQRIAVELDDLMAVAQILHVRGILPDHSDERTKRKRERVALYMDYARACGTLEDPEVQP